eukprot:3172288-Alexandrium_andersonii.AAC.1
MARPKPGGYSCVSLSLEDPVMCFLLFLVTSDTMPVLSHSLLRVNLQARLARKLACDHSRVGFLVGAPYMPIHV